MAFAGNDLFLGGVATGFGGTVGVAILRFGAGGVSQVQPPILAGDDLVVSICAAADTLVVTRGSETAAVFRRNSAGTYAQVGTLSGFANEQFGYSVAIDESATTIVVGAPASGVNPTAESGRAYVYKRSGSTNNWTQIATLGSSSPAPVAFARFGASVSISGSRVLCTTADDSGKAFVFRRNGDSFSLEQVLQNTDQDDGLYRGIISNDWIWLGTDAYDPVFDGFQLAGTSWTWRQSIVSDGWTAPMSFASDTFATSGLVYSNDVFRIRIRAFKKNQSGNAFTPIYTGLSPPAGLFGHAHLAINGDLVAANAGTLSFGSVDGYGGAFLFDTELDDCNNNGTPDECDILAGTLQDVNQNSVPDQCESGVIPANVAATDGTLTTGVQISWGGSTGATGFQVYRAVGSGSPTLLASPSSSPYTDATAVTGTVYSYSVKAQFIGGWSASSAPNTGWRNVPAPSGLSASDGTLTTGVSLAWNPVSGASGYRIFRAIGSTTPTEVAQVAAIPTTHLDATAVAGTTYSYSVRAFTAPGDSATGNADTGWRNLPAPTSLAATDGTLTTGVNLTWSPVAGAASYKIFRSAGGPPSTQVANPSASPFLDSSAVAGVQYSYAVRAVSASGDSQPSSPDDGWRNIVAPTGLTAGDGTRVDGIVLGWNQVAGATGYRVLRSIGSGTPTEIGTPAANSFLDETAEPGVVYTFVVRARSDAGDSAASGSNTGWRNILAPTGVSASDGTQTDGVNLVWDSMPGATGYRVYRSANGGAPSEIAAPASHGHLDSTALAGVVYSYTVRARSPGGNSTSSDPETGWRNVPAPSNVAATDGTLTTGVRVSWTAVAGATGYRVFRSVGSEAPAEIATPSGTPFLDTTAAVGTAYSYLVRARTVPGSSEPSLSDSGYRGIPSPTGVVAGDGTSTAGVPVAWNPIPGATEYRVFRSGALIGTSVESSFLDSTAPIGATFPYTVRAFNPVTGLSGSSTSDSGWRNVPAPTGFDATDGLVTNGVTLSWNSVEGASGYRVFRSLGAATPTQVAQVAATSISHTDTSAAVGTTYQYSVRAFTAPGNSAASAPNSGWRNAAPPTNLAATDGTLTTGVSVSWTASAGASGYRVYRSEGGETPSEVGTQNASPFLDTTAVPGVTYSYHAKARTASGDSLGLSNSNSGFRGMPAPTGVVASDGSSTDGVQITWNPVNGATQYLVFRSGITGAIATVAGTAHLDVSPPGTSFTYTVRSTNAPGSLVSAASVGDTGWRNVPAPTAVNATDGSLATGVRVSWTPVSPSTGVTGYRVLRASGSATPVLVGSAGSAASFYLDTSAVAGTPYLYSVQTATAAGNSSPGGPDPGWRDVTAPASLVASDGTSTNHVALSWPAVPGATGYVVFRRENAGEFSLLTTSTSAAHNDVTATPSVRYHYEIAVQTAAGLSPGPRPTNDGWRNVLPPANVQASDGTSLASITVTWNAVEHASGYRVLRASGTAIPTVQVAEIDDPSIRTFVDTAVTPGSPFNYAVKAKVATPGESAPSASNAGFAGVAAPTNLQATDGTTTSAVSITWNLASPSAGVTGYRIYRSGTAAPLATVSATTTLFNDTGAIAGQEFTYSVRGLSAAGESPGSPTDAGWRNLPAPTNVQATDGTLCGRVRVTWTTISNPNVTGYGIYRSIGAAPPIEIAFVQQSVAPFGDDLSPPAAGQVGSYTVRARMAPGDTAPGGPNSGFPGNCMAGDGETDGHAGDIWAGSPGDDRAPDGEIKDGNASIPSSSPTDLGSQAPPSEPGQDSATSDPGADMPDCKQACSRIRSLLESIRQGVGPQSKGLEEGLRTLIETQDGADEESTRACRMLAGDVNLDGTVDGVDAIEFLLAWAEWDLVRGDLNRDGVIDDRDLSIVYAGGMS